MIIVISFLLTFTIILNGCNDTITDSITDKKIKALENSDQSLTKKKVETDGMVVNGYDSPHPLGMNQEVLVDYDYYDKNEVSRGDIVVFKTKNNINQDTDIARIVGLPGETIIIKKGQVYINGNKLDTFYGKDYSTQTNDSMDIPLQLNEKEYFILADIRWRGMNDSQSAAGFRKEEIVGKVVGY
ncbi:signal peptidase I [Paenibacillus castaneae]|uniref:signal peptidase I n=1 Tax=Paenibacillus castaneae TaxID=474957 RepID=UPI001FBACCF1|nr:signal peptidase I [Paenibacillus castaneae]NIK76502.1 signal peptidase I [Paenibacillus castaneae]